MNTKSLLIPAAAFAVAVTGVQAYDSTVLEDAGLNDDQIAAFEAAKELRQDGDREGARDLLAEAGIDEDILQSIKETMQAKKRSRRSEIHEAVDSQNYEAFMDAVEGSPLSDIINSEADFELFVEAHELIENGQSHKQCSYV